MRRNQKAGDWISSCPLFRFWGNHSQLCFCPICCKRDRSMLQLFCQLLDNGNYQPHPNPPQIGEGTVLRQRPFALRRSGSSPNLGEVGRGWLGSYRLRMTILTQRRRVAEDRRGKAKTSFNHFSAFSLHLCASASKRVALQTVSNSEGEFDYDNIN